MSPDVENNDTYGSSVEEKKIQDVERRRSSTTVGGRRMSRIAPPKIGEIPSDSGSGDEHAKLTEMEAENAIKYRTCSWQKVRN